ncbi:MAG TPA: SDR family oxidoreductase [Alphaproteobacteria bacterium]|nr:SDR family oxidoreductase [Alphaproteobacteria bacterium]
MFDLSGRVALVTGAGRNTGAGIARCLAEHGAAVAINDLVAERAEDVARALRDAGHRVHACAFDVTRAEDVAQGVAVAERALGPVDILVNNAGVPEGMSVTPFREMPPEAWKTFIDLNLYGVLHCTRAVLDGMCARGFGRLVTISSGAGQVGLPLGVSIYGAGKGGAIAFMRHVAMEVAGAGVTANTLALGLMSNVGDANVTAALARTVPIGRLGTPEDVGAAVVWLASDEAGWMTGQTIGLNGGSVTS